MITKDDIANEYYYDKTLGELIRITGNTRFNPEERVSPYSNIIVCSRAVREHRAIWMLHNGEIPEGMAIDHKDGNTRNNRIENLRLCTIKENNRNKGVMKNNRCGFKGVYQRKNCRYGASIRAEKTVWLGVFDTPEEAAMAYDMAAIQYFGEFARTNKSLGLL